jgi:isopropylmalate/homocitrate/citramalate synthase
LRKSIFKKLEAQGLIANYNRMRKNLPPRLPERVHIWDETLREGVQTPSVFLTYVEKVKLAKMMDEIGVSVINVGYPALSEEEKNSVRRIANEGFHQASLVGTARITRSDIDACLETGLREIAITTPYNGLNLQYRFKMSKEQALQKTVESVDYARKHGVKINFVLEDGSRTPIDDIVKIFESAVKSGSDRLVIADTAGFLRPLSIRYLISHVREELSRLKVKNVPLSVQCQNDFGLATANSLAAVEEGVSYVQASIVGFGERAGGAPLEEVATALELLYDVDTGIDLTKLYRFSQLAEKTFALPVQFHKPLIGDNVFSHESDERVEGMLANPLIYEPFPPEIIGRETQYYLSRQTGKRLIERRLEEAGIKASPMQVDEIMRRMRRMHESADKGEAQMTFYQIKKLMKELRKGLSEEELWKIVEDVARQKPKLKQPEATVTA